MHFYDAHAHLPDLDSRGAPATNPTALNSSGRSYSVINGTSPDDWSAVLHFAQRHSEIVPAIGLHPQNVQHVAANWKETFLKLLDKSKCAIGEVGLDLRNQNKGIPADHQLEAFCWQLEQAETRNLPISIHCVKAVGLLMETLRSHTLPSRGVHLHGCCISVELIPELAELGAYFSFSASQLNYNSTKIQDRIRAIPIQKLLIETDVAYTSDISTLYDCYTTVAKVRGVPLGKLSECVESNFKTYFLAH